MGRAELGADDIPFTSQLRDATPAAIESLPDLLRRLATTEEPPWIVEGLLGNHSRGRPMD